MVCIFHLHAWFQICTDTKKIKLFTDQVQLGLSPKQSCPSNSPSVWWYSSKTIKMFPLELGGQIMCNPKVGFDVFVQRVKLARRGLVTNKATLSSYSTWEQVWQRRAGGWWKPGRWEAQWWWLEGEGRGFLEPPSCFSQQPGCGKQWRRRMIRTQLWWWLCRRHLRHSPPWHFSDYWYSWGSSGCSS